MSAIALEVNDAGFVLLREGETRPRPDSPGVALFEDGAVLLGAAAAARSRLLPRAVHDRFWDPPLVAPLGPGYPAGLRRADLAHAHLRSLSETLPEPPSAVLLAVPGSWDVAALGLLLSLARGAGLAVTGLVDAAVAACAFFARAEALLHLDLTRHRAVVTVVRGGAAVERRSVAERDGLGLAAFERALIEAIARRFVVETRFDPLHSGSAEQALQDSLGPWLAELRREGSCAARMKGGRREHALELSPRALAADLDGLYGALREQLAAQPTPASAVVLASARVAILPGLLERLRSELAREVIELPRDATVSATLRFRAQIDKGGEALPFVTRLEA